MPAVSTSSSVRPSTSIGVSIASRVVPATAETITRSRPRKALTRLDLPTFGRPITASRTMSSSSSASSSSSGTQLDEAVEQVAGAEPLRGGDRQRLAEAEAVEVGDEREVVRRVDLVRGDDDRQLPAAQDLRDLLVARPHPRARVDHEQRDLGVGDRLARLVLDRDGQRVLVVEVDAAGVDQRAAAAVPLGRELLAVARDARPLVDDRLARLGEAVDERGLADVGIADDGDLHRSSRASTASMTTWATTSSSVRPVVSIGTASGAGSRTVRAPVASRRSRSSCSRRTSWVSPPRCGDAAAGALFRVGGEEDLDGGVGRDHGGDVAALRDPVAVGHDRLLLGDQRVADALVGCDLDAALGDLGRADRSVTSSPSMRTRSPTSMSMLRGDLRRVAAGLRGECDGAVHRPRIEVGEAELARDCASHRGLAGSGRAVDRDDHSAGEVSYADVLHRIAASQRERHDPGPDVERVVLVVVDRRAAADLRRALLDRELEHRGAP